MRLSAFILFILCVFQIVANCYEVYPIPVYKQHDKVCFNKISSFIDDEQNLLCKKYRICKLFVCVTDMVFGWFINGAKKIFDCLKEDEAVKQIQINELASLKDISLENKLNQRKQTHVHMSGIQKKNVKKRLPITNNRRLRIKNKNEDTEQSFLEKTYKCLLQEPSPYTKNVIHNVNMPVQNPPQKLVNKISFRSIDLKKYYNFFLGAHLLTIFIATYKFLRSFYRWAPVNFYDIILRNITFNVEKHNVDVATEVNEIDTDSDESDMENMSKNIVKLSQFITQINTSPVVVKYNRRSKQNYS